MELQFWHHPHCSKSCTALALLQARGIAPDVVHGLETPPDATMLHRLIAILGGSARGLLRTGESDCLRLGLDAASANDSMIIEAMTSYPHLIDRPVFIRGARAVIGRPPERVLDLLDDPDV